MNELTQESINNERFRLAMRGTNDGLWDWNLETNAVFYSPRWKSMLGYEEDELNNNIDTWASLVHPDDKENVLSQVNDYLAEKKPHFEAEMRLQHKKGHYIYVLSRAFSQARDSDDKPVRLIGTHVDITARKNAEAFNKRTADILGMIALGESTPKIYDAIALLYEHKHPGMRCSMLELSEGTLLHGGAPSMPKEYCDAVHGLKNGPNVGSCGASTYTGTRCLVENIDTHPNWKDIKGVALPHGMKSCWSEPIKDNRGKVLGAFGMYYNHPALPNAEESEDLTSAARLAGIVMQRDHDQKHMRELAFTDALTGLASRAHFYQHVESLVKTSKRYQRQFSLLYIDLDDFKNVNDSLGHDAGDLLLIEIAKRLKTIGREVDFVSRLSGDEFCLVIAELESSHTSSNIANRCFDMVSQPVSLLGITHTPTCSIGIAHYPNDGKSLSVLLKAADTALYSAKELGKNRYAFYEPALTQKVEYQFLFDKLLREAINKQQLSLVYQPQVDALTGKIIGVEALSRWFHPELGQVSAIDFIKAAERIGMIKPLTEWVLTTACTQAAVWIKAGLPPIRMSVNISPSHFIDANIISLVQKVLNKTLIAPNLLELEVTENIAQTSPENLINFKKLKDIGVSIAIDDFGTGFSSFASLKHLDINCLKIDQYFINDISTEANSRMLVSSMIEIGHNLGHSIVAEGVETQEQLSLLQELKCDMVQGSFFCKPESPEIIASLLQDKLPI